MANFVNNFMSMNDFSTSFKNFILNVMIPLTQDVFPCFQSLILLEEKQK
jgi:hypothetical protein